MSASDSGIGLRDRAHQLFLRFLSFLAFPAFLSFCSFAQQWLKWKFLLFYLTIYLHLSSPTSKFTSYSRTGRRTGCRCQTHCLAKAHSFLSVFIWWRNTLAEYTTTQLTLLINFFVFTRNLMNISDGWNTLRTTTIIFIFGRYLWIELARPALILTLTTKQETQVWFLGQKIPWTRDWLLTPVFLTGEFHGQRSRPWVMKSQAGLSD